jgi:hypothetical protein
MASGGSAWYGSYAALDVRDHDRVYFRWQKGKRRARTASPLPEKE